mmetsp:Transcript_3470/g.5579  ORF Transcript_3470/g.5579 Transcript_3470/m.5579 type:complete len:436 (-) Transcript_3470:48-1355(-)
MAHSRMIAFALISPLCTGHMPWEHASHERLMSSALVEDRKPLKPDVNQPPPWVLGKCAVDPLSTLAMLLLAFRMATAFSHCDPPVQRHAHNPAVTIRQTSMNMKLSTKGSILRSRISAASAQPKKRAEVVPLDPSITAALAELEKGNQSIQRYLSPHLFEDPATMLDIARRLQAGEIVVLRNAFRPAFAEMVHTELQAGGMSWELDEEHGPAFAKRHHNVYDKSSWSARLNSTLNVFASDETKRFMQELTGRDCQGATAGSVSWYKEGDYSMPHTDWAGQRTVAFVWHLSKNWRPEWGGSFYWAQNDFANAIIPASFNTLILHSVTTRSAHLVTTVSPLHQGKRLAFNGWWHAAWMPNDVDDELEEVLVSEEKRRGVTYVQMQAITELLFNPALHIPAARREYLQGLHAQLMEELSPHGVRVGTEFLPYRIPGGY